MFTIPRLALALCFTLLFAKAAEAAGPLRAYDPAQGKAVSEAELFDRLAAADVVFMGEVHDDPAGHRFELRVLEALTARDRTVALGLEMFERQQQPLLAAYVADRIVEKDMLGRITPWPTYAADYRPLVEFAKARGWTVTGTNAPRPLAARVAMGGLGVLRTLPAPDRRLAARDLVCPNDAYRTKFMTAMGHGPTHRGALQRIYLAQCLKDETMAESLAALARPGITVVHINGAFHSDARLGTVARLIRRRPELKIVVISIVPTKALEPGETLATSGVEADILVLPEP